jgi:hypothetical protein
MFLGHFAAAFASKKADKSISLGAAILAAQWLDLIWPIFLLTGIEKASISTLNRGIPIVFDYYPFSHSLIAVILWALLFGGCYYWIKRKKGPAIIIGLLVLSHWFLDWLVHVPDLSILFSGDYKTGLGLWNFKYTAMFIEVILFLPASYFYLNSIRRYPSSKKNITWALIIFLLIIHVLNTVGAPPENIQQVAIVGLSQWLLVAWGFWADRQ